MQEHLFRMATTSNYEKYQTANPLMRRIIARFLDRVGSHLAVIRPSKVVDLGCGEGLVVEQLERLPAPVQYLGLELNPVALEHARRLHPGREFVQGDLLSYPPRESSADVVLCLEVLEHMREPSPAVERIACWTGDRAIISVPWEPWFRVGNFFRGKYLAQLGNHPEHVQQFNPASFAALLGRSFEEVRVETCFPWLIGLCRKRTSGSAGAASARASAGSEPCA